MAEVDEIDNLDETWAIYRQSKAEMGDTKLFLARSAFEKRFGVVGDFSGFIGNPVVIGNIHLFPLTAENAIELRRRLPWLILCR